MGHLTYEQSKSIATKTIILLGVITVVEVIIALLGKGHIKESITIPAMILGLIMIILSAIKAYYIVYEFMHMKYEVPGMVKSVLLPTLLLVWGVIAFSWEGKFWNQRRSLIKDKNEESVEKSRMGFLFLDAETKQLG